jgi:2-succinyl-5-enolpyruvyl-6-hydroxy-3-cyclohexene-1-carboxylate synthase
VDMSALAAAYGVGHASVRTTAELAAVLDSPLKGRSIVEVRTDRSDLRPLHARIKVAVASAVSQ